MNDEEAASAARSQAYLLRQAEAAGVVAAQALSMAAALSERVQKLEKLTHELEMRLSNVPLKYG